MQSTQPPIVALVAAAAFCHLAAARPQAQAEPAPLPAADEPVLSFEEANALASHPSWLSLKYAEFDTAAGEPAMPADLAAKPLPDGERGYFLAQFDGAITEALRASVAATGAELLDYVPNHAFIVRATSGELAAVAALGETLWTGALHPAYRLDARLRAASGDPALASVARRVVVQSFAGAGAAAWESQLASAGVPVLESGEVDGRFLAVVSATPVEARVLAQAHDVQWVEPEGVLTSRNTTVQWTVQTFVNGDRKVWTKGLHGEGQTIGHIDGSIALSACYFADPEGDPVGPNHRKVAYNSGGGSDSHGTHTAGTAAGDAQPINGSTANRGLAYLARIAHTSGFPFSTFSSVATTHMNNGARVHTNSWGDDGTTAYNTLCNQIDSFSWTNEDNLVFFAVTNTSTLKNPENAKNLLAVGASQNGASANSFCSGGAGPTADGRRKPEIYTPGCSISSASTSSCGTTSMTGTSMASPSSTAAGALVRQYFADGFYPTGAAVPGDAFVPTGALIKAVLVNTTQDMTGVGGYPSNQEGWGRINLDESLYFAGDTGKLIAADVRKANGLTTGAFATLDVTVNSNALPLEVTLAFHDYPGTVNASNPVINNLDLTVTAPDGTTVYKGNVFSGGWSATGGTADAKNNVERVAIQSPTTGTWVVKVTATNVPQPNQGYALAITGDVQSGPGNPGSNPTSYCTSGITSGLCGPFMSASGTASATASSGFVLTANQVEGDRQGILFYGVSGRAAMPWGQTGASYLCVHSPVQRTGAQNSGGIAGTCGGALTLDWNAYVYENPGCLGWPFTAGDVVNAQGWFRDPWGLETTALTDGIEFTVQQ
jgi:hypothetical protein